MADAGKLASVSTPWTLLMTPARMKTSQTYCFVVTYQPEHGKHYTNTTQRLYMCFLSIS